MKGSVVKRQGNSCDIQSIAFADYVRITERLPQFIPRRYTQEHLIARWPDGFSFRTQSRSHQILARLMTDYGLTLGGLFSTRNLLSPSCSFLTHHHRCVTFPVFQNSALTQSHHHDHSHTSMRRQPHLLHSPFRSNCSERHLDDRCTTIVPSALTGGAATGGVRPVDT